MRDTILRDAIMTGGMEAIGELILDTPARADAEDLLVQAAQALGQIEAIKEREQSAQIAGIRHFCDRVADLSRRLDTFVAERKEQARRDAAEEQAAIKRKLDAHPDPDESGHQPAGDLHTLPAKDVGDPLPDPDDPEGTILEQDQQGVATRPVNDPAELAHGPLQPNQPTSISLMSEE
jgi:hypothetical protein